MGPHRPKQEFTPCPDPKYPPEFYEILVQGQLDDLWESWFVGMTISNINHVESGETCTLISGQVADQAALHGLLIKIRDLNLKLLLVRQVIPEKNTKVETDINLDE